MKYTFSAIITLILLYGCGGHRDTHVEAVNESLHLALSNIEWKLNRIQNIDLTQTEVINNQPTLNFNLEEFRLYGFGGCNRYTGSYLIGEDNRIEFSRIVSTKMACPEMDIEQTFYKQLENVTIYEVDQNGKILILTDENLEEVLVFHQEG